MYRTRHFNPACRAAVAGTSLWISHTLRIKQVHFCCLKHAQRPHVAQRAVRLRRMLSAHRCRTATQNGLENLLFLMALFQKEAYSTIYNSTLHVLFHHFILEDVITLHPQRSAIRQHYQTRKGLFHLKITCKVLSRRISYSILWYQKSIFFPRITWRNNDSTAKCVEEIRQTLKGWDYFSDTQHHSNTGKCKFPLTHVLFPHQVCL